MILNFASCVICLVYIPFLLNNFENFMISRSRIYILYVFPCQAYRPVTPLDCRIQNQIREVRRLGNIGFCLGDGPCLLPGITYSPPYHIALSHNYEVYRAPGIETTRSFLELAVPLLGQAGQFRSILYPKRDCAVLKGSTPYRAVLMQPLTNERQRKWEYYGGP